MILANALFIYFEIFCLVGFNQIFTKIGHENPSKNGYYSKTDIKLKQNERFFNLTPFESDVIKLWFYCS